jgi:hypothetical protein
MKDRKTKQAIEDALQKKDIELLAEKMEEGFRGMHDRQDTTNGKVLKAAEDIVELKNWKAFVQGGMAVLTLMVVPILIYIITHWK